MMMANEIDLEDGELTDSGDDEVYTPLQRPAPLSCERVATTASPLAARHQIQRDLVDDDESQTNSDDYTSSGGSSSEGCIKKLRSDEQTHQPKQRKRKKRIQRTVMVRVEPSVNDMQPSRARFKKYNVWTAALQEDALTETMRGCDVTHNASSDRNVENYDFSLKYRLNGENSLKRRLSNNSTDDELPPANKRGRPSGRDANEYSQRRSVKSRLGYRSRGRRSQRGSSSASGSDNSCEPRHLLDLNDTAGREPFDVAREMANKLQEEKDELLLRVVEELGVELPVEIYKETQRIEADGGMMINNGKRRRTAGGVFFFLLKHHDSLTPEQQKSIFVTDRQHANKTRKEIESMMRDRKVEELKKRLSEQGNELPTLNTRKDHFLLGSDLSTEHQVANLSNPPPSPVGHDQSSPEYKTHAINHVTAESPTTSAAAAAAFKVTAELVSYDDDFLDVNCGEMDLF